jgi:hypothetical protein
MDQAPEVLRVLFRTKARRVRVQPDASQLDIEVSQNHGGRWSPKSVNHAPQ